MKPRSYNMNPNGPVLPPGSAPGAVRKLTLGKRDWELVVPGGEWGGEWTWKRTALLERTWSLIASGGTYLVLCGPDVFQRRWRAEAATAGWTLARSWVSRTIVTDDDGVEILRYEPGAWGRGPIVPASGPELKLRWHWTRGFSLESRDGHPLFSLARASGFFSRDHRLTLSDAVRAREDLLPLLALTWLMVLSARHSHAH